VRDTSLVVVILVAIVFLLVWSRRGSAARRPEAVLERVCRGNMEQAERLIAGEMARTPGITRAEAARRAVERYQRDNR
jgi:hypothetical protein